ncbi:hypothetical protein BJ875DRAFT_488129 [Amylocarpus encephaloides]|uniref:Uncharacterized protein n=1 Tax=Amylocarpus encephaloides TaxID=45428 RepID=A0A9P7YAW8_9HELO|nr:hypothetical protein BJ875DRAFT_488129 [Amylocarpus encephaloides]
MNELDVNLSYPADNKETKIVDSSSFDDDVFPVKEIEDQPYKYPGVRAAAQNYDEDVSCNTIRAYKIGLSLVFLIALMNTLFSLRAPIGLGALVAQLIA